MDVNVDDPGVKNSLIERLKGSSRQARYRFHQHFLKYRSLEEAKNNKPPTFPDEDKWKELCDYFSTPEFLVFMK